MTDTDSAAVSPASSGNEGGTDKTAKKKRLGLFSRAALFFRQVVAELRKVVWPARSELVSYTGVVITFCTLIIALVYVLDIGIRYAVEWVFA